MIDKLYHFTSADCWEQIQKDGVLKPLTEVSAGKLSDRVKDVITDSPYLVGIPPSKVEAWKKYDLMENLLNHVGRGFGMFVAIYSERKEDLVLLEVPINNPENAFVREHKFISPKYTAKFDSRLFSEIEGMYASSGMSMASDEQMEMWESFSKEWLDSAVRLTDYDGSFKVPELYLHQETPLEQVELIKQFRAKDFF